MEDVITKNIQLAAFLLTEIPLSTFHIERSSNQLRHTIIISFPEQSHHSAMKLMDKFHRCEAQVSLFTFNAKLNQIRDSLKKG